jgi:hypothetical protein
MEVPQMMSGSMLLRSSARMTPMCAQPRAAPLPSASPMRSWFCFPVVMPQLSLFRRSVPFGIGSIITGSIITGSIITGSVITD